MLNKDFKEFAGLLNSISVETMVVGGYANRIVTVLQGTALAFIGIEDFRSNKRATGRHKDLADLESLDDSEKPRGT